MSKYTTEVRYICEAESGLDESVGYNDVEQVLANSINSIFGDFPIFDEEYRPILEKKILRHYYTREIAFETVGLWKLKLNTKMNEIMPYYNKLYESELLEFDPFEDTNLKTEKSAEKARNENEERNRDNTGDVYKASQNRENMHDATVDGSERWDLFSNTPQGQLSNVKQGKYLTTADNLTTNASGTEDRTTDNNGTNTEVRNELGKELRNKNGSDLEEYFEKIKGKRGVKSYPLLLEEFRKTFLNIDMLIINELKSLFFLLW